MERRDFLKNLGMSGAALTLPAVVVEAAPITSAGKRDITNLTLKGS
jgi:hypothetical protein